MATQLGRTLLFDDFAQSSFLLIAKLLPKFLFSSYKYTDWEQNCQNFFQVWYEIPWRKSEVFHSQKSLHKRAEQML